MLVHADRVPLFLQRLYLRQAAFGIFNQNVFDMFQPQYEPADADILYFEPERLVLRVPLRLERFVKLLDVAHDHVYFIRQPFQFGGVFFVVGFFEFHAELRLVAEHFAKRRLRGEHGRKGVVFLREFPQYVVISRVFFFKIVLDETVEKRNERIGKQEVFRRIYVDLHLVPRKVVRQIEL